MEKQRPPRRPVPCPMIPNTGDCQLWVCSLYDAHVINRNRSARGSFYSMRKGGDRGCQGKVAISFKSFLGPLTVPPSSAHHRPPPTAVSLGPALPPRGVSSCGSRCARPRASVPMLVRRSRQKHGASTSRQAVGRHFVTSSPSSLSRLGGRGTQACAPNSSAGPSCTLHRHWGGGEQGKVPAPRCSGSFLAPTTPRGRY